MVVSDRFDKGKNSISYKNIFSYHDILVGPCNPGYFEAGVCGCLEVFILAILCTIGDIKIIVMF